MIRAIFENSMLTSTSHGLHVRIRFVVLELVVVVVVACCYISAIIMLGGDVSESRELLNRM
jgi:hypothetical protein